MDNMKLLEEKLREAACFGDIETIKELLAMGVNVNSQNDVNGWSALHWAAHRNYINIVDILLKCGADKTSLTTKGETPYNLSSNKEVQILLEGVPYTKEQQKLPITPNYLSSPPLYVSKTSTIMPKSSEVINHDNSEGAVKTNEELVLKVRLADSEDLDFIEIELPENELTFAKLVETCCEELNILSNAIAKIRKLPDTILRKDKDVLRLKNFQEIEVVPLKVLNTSSASTSSSSSSTQSIMVNRNQYESISLKKDQKILY